jgi:hypothetical protein
MGRVERIRIAVMVGMSIGLLAGTVYAETPTADLPLLNLEKGLYFKASGGDPVLVNPGEYVVEVAEQGIQLMPTTEEGKSFVIEAEKTAVEESLVLSTANANPDLQNFMVVMPDGIVYETVGSYTGIWPRGGEYAPIRRAQNKPRGKCDTTRKKCAKFPKINQGRPVPVSSKSLKDFHKADHLAATVAATAETLCKPIKDTHVRGECVSSISRSLMSSRFSPKYRGK